MDKYTKIEKLGEGAFGVVYKAKRELPAAAATAPGGRSAPQQLIVALKQVRRSADEGIPTAAIKEIALLKELKHPNIIRLFDVIKTDKKITLVQEYMDHDLKKHIDDAGGPLGPSAVKSLTQQLLRAVAFCHHNRVLHRDLKPQNLLINTRGELKLADFGLARSFGLPIGAMSTDVVTLWYRAPDILCGATQYNTSIDLWSVGCILAELASGRPLFPGRDQQDQLRCILGVLGVPNTETWPSMPTGHYLLNPLIFAVMAAAASNNAGSAADSDSLPPPRTSVSEGRHSLSADGGPGGIGLAAATRGTLDAVGLDLLGQLLQYEPSARLAAHKALQHPYFADKD